MFNRRLCSFAAGTHQHDDSFGIGCSHKVEKLIHATGQISKFLHGLLHNRGRGRVVEVRCLAGLEENVRVLGRAPDDWSIGCERALSMGSD